MKVTHVIVGLGVGGAELMLKRLIEGTSSDNGIEHRVISLTTTGEVGKELLENSIEVIPMSMKGLYTIPKTFWKLFHEFKNNKPDIVHTWMYHADFLGGLAAKLAGINNIIWGVRTTNVKAGSSKITVLLRGVCSFLSSYVPSCILYVAHTSKRLHEELGYNQESSEVIPNGFDLSRLRFSKDTRESYRSEFAVKEDEILIASIGRFNSVKNQRAFVETAALLANKHSNVTFMIVGRDNCWSNEELSSWIDALSLRHRFILLGERHDIPNILSSIDMFVLHSKTEGFPNALGEAMSIGVPCVAMNVGDVPFLMGDFGAIPAENTPESLSSKISDLLLLPNTELKYYGKNLQIRISENFELNKVLGSYCHLYKRFL